MLYATYADMLAKRAELFGDDPFVAKQELVYAVLSLTALFDPEATQGEDSGTFMVYLPYPHEKAGHFMVSFSTTSEVPITFTAVDQHGGVTVWEEQPYGADFPADSLFADLVRQGHWVLPLLCAA